MLNAVTGFAVIFFVFFVIAVGRLVGRAKVFPDARSRLPLNKTVPLEFLGRSVDLSGIELYAALILAASPTAQNVYNYAAMYRRGETVARDAVFLSTFGAMPVMLGIAALFGG